VADPFWKTLDEGKQSAIVTEGFLLLHTQVRMAIGCQHFFVEKLGRLGRKRAWHLCALLSEKNTIFASVLLMGLMPKEVSSTIFFGDKLANLRNISYLCAIITIKRNCL